MKQWDTFYQRLVMSSPYLKNANPLGIKIASALVILMVVVILPVFDSMILNVIKEEFAKTISCLIGIPWLYTFLFSSFEFVWSYSTYINQTMSPDLFQTEIFWRVIVIFVHFVCTWIQWELIKDGKHFLLATAFGSLGHLIFNFAAG